MARPPFKRRRSNAQSPSASRRAPPNAGMNNASRVKLQQRLGNKAIGQRPQDSDDSDRLVTRARGGRRQSSDSELYASGGVAKGDTPGAMPSREERRQRLRSETDEIIRRSRSKSADGVNGVSAKSPVASNDNGVNGTSAAVSKQRVPASKSPQPLPTKPQATPIGDTSVLGTLKPRRRQPSILHMIDNNDSSIINPEDEDQFLPDDVSTPLDTARSQVALVKSTPVNTNGSSTSKKRKFAAEEPANGPDTVDATSPAAASSSPLSDPISLPTASSRQQSAAADDDDIMAPPQSSSPEASPQKPRSPAPTKSSKAPIVLTTEQLQSLMPAKRRKGTRQRNQRDEFDVPQDSSSDPVDEVEDESIFQPVRRSKKARGKKGTVSPSNSRAKARTAGKAVASHNQTPKSKSTRNAPLSALPITPRTPLPLTRNTNQENKRAAPNSKHNGDKNGSGITTASKRLYGKQSGGSLHPPRRGGLRNRPGVTTGAESDKENQGQVQRLTRSSRKRTTGFADDVAGEDEVHPSIEAPDTTDMDEVPEAVRGTSSSPLSDIDDDAPMSADVYTNAVPKTPMSAEAKAWNKQWADIDNWDLDYEEVSISTESNSPMRR